MTLSEKELEALDAYWRATNYLSVGQIYLRDNPLLREPLTPEHIKSTLLGHWGTTPGQNFIYVHLNQMINKYKQSVLYISGPGHGGPALLSNTYLEGSFSEFYPDVTQDEAGMLRLFRLFSFPGGLPSHVSPHIPGSMHEGGELGYSLSHAYGTVFDNPDLITACVVGDGEAETGPLATAWHSNKFINPITDGAVLPILHLNGYKISNPTILARIERDELEQLFRGYGYTPYFVEGEDPLAMHQLMTSQLNQAFEDIKRIQKHARDTNDPSRPRWPMIILSSPKGWTGPKFVDDKKVEGNFRSHQVPITLDGDPVAKTAQIEEWLRSYEPEKLFESNGALRSDIAELAPKGMLRMGMNENANGGTLLRELRMPDFRDYAVDIPTHGGTIASNTTVTGHYLRDVTRLNLEKRNFRLFGPDETVSNKLDPIFEVTPRQWNARIRDTDEFLAQDGLVLDSMLSEHQVQGWLEGYLLTGRHGLLHSYEAFIRIIDSMVSQHAKWIKMSSELSWRNEIASLNYLLTSHVWRQDHNGFTHQDPGFIDHIVNKKANTARVYLPPDANTLLSVTDHCLRSRNYINLIICDKHDSKQWLSMEEAVEHATEGVSKWEWASTDDGDEPDVVIASAGDTPTHETLAAVMILKKELPELKIRYINVIDLMKLQDDADHPHGLGRHEYDHLFTTDKPIVFAFHGYPWLIHRLTYKRTNQNLHVRGYVEEGTITTAFDMTVMNRMDRFNLVIDVIDRTNYGKTDNGMRVRELMQKKLLEHKNYIHHYGVDMDEVANWEWQD